MDAAFAFGLDSILDAGLICYTYTILQTNQKEMDVT